mmetsp:Transcript_3336/g.12118  ORF Transcript_3336/g.12118 Transcript_3336/m.12118 type:complete len:185 (-) Transcript_3336:48-602(-)
MATALDFAAIMKAEKEKARRARAARRAAAGGAAAGGGGGAVIGDAGTCAPDGCPAGGVREVLCCHSWIAQCHSDDPSEAVPYQQLCVSVAGEAPATHCSAHGSGSGSGSGRGSGSDSGSTAPPEGGGDDTDWKLISIVAAAAFVVVGLIVTAIVYKRGKRRREVPLLSFAESIDHAEGETYVRL